MNRTTATLTMVAASILALVPSSAALAHPEHGNRHPLRQENVMHVRTVGAWLCGGTLILGYGTERYNAASRSWAFVQDDGRMDVQVERAGTWRTLPSVSGGEGIRRVNPTDVVALERVRAIRADATKVAASARLVSGSCPS